MKINFLVACGDKVGLGHIYRSLGLAKTLLQRGHEITFAPSSIMGHAIATNHAEGMNLLWPGEEMPKGDWTIVDCVGAPEPTWIGKSCFLGGTGSDKDGQYIENYDLVICGGLPFDASRLTRKWACGFDYVLLWPGLEQYRKWGKKEQVFLYTSVYSGVVGELAGCLREKFQVVPPEVISNPCRLDEYLAHSAVAVMPWGMTTIEAMRLGIPSVTFNMNPYAAKSVEFAADYGAVRLVDSNNPRFVERVILNVELLMDDFRKQGEDYSHMRRRGKSLIDGLGCARTADCIEAL